MTSAMSTTATGRAPSLRATDRPVTAAMVSIRPYTTGIATTATMYIRRVMVVRNSQRATSSALRTLMTSATSVPPGGPPSLPGTSVPPEDLRPSRGTSVPPRDLRPWGPPSHPGTSVPPGDLRPSRGTSVPPRDLRPCGPPSLPGTSVPETADSRPLCHPHEDLLERRRQPFEAFDRRAGRDEPMEKLVTARAVAQVHFDGLAASILASDAIDQRAGAVVGRRPD